MSAWRRAAYFSLLAGITLAVYLPSVGNDFVNWDDDRNFLKNEHYRGFAPDNLRWIFTTFHHGHYQPLSWLTLALDYELWGMNPAGYHFTSIALHALSAGLFGLLVLELMMRFGTQRLAQWGARVEIISGIMALLWALHPLRVEAVTWITERREVLCGVLTLAALLIHVRGGRNWIVTLLGTFALLAKATAVVLPALLVLTDFYSAGAFSNAAWRRSVGRSLRRHGVLIAAALACCVAAVFAQGASEAIISSEHLAWYTRIALYFYGVLYYFAKTIWPSGLAPLHQGQERLTWDLEPFVYWLAVVGVLLAVAGVASALRMRRRAPAAFPLVAAYLLMLLPVGGLVQSGPQIAAERYAYQPGWVLSVGLALPLLEGARRMRLRPRDLGIAATATLVVLAFFNVRQQRFWFNGETLWQRELVVHPRSAYALFNLGFMRANQQPPDWTGAEPYYRQALDIAPDFPNPRIAMADLLRNTGRAEKAEELFRAALSAEPDRLSALAPFGLLLWDTGRREEARRCFEHIAKLDPKNPVSYWQLARAEAALGEFAKARQTFLEGLERARPDVDLLTDYSWLLSTCATDSIRDGKRAIELIEAARRLQRGFSPRLTIAITAAYAENGDFERAQREVRAQLTAADPRARAALQNLLDQMERREPVRAEQRFR